MKEDSNGCVLSFCSDGVNPYKSMHVVYSVWSIMLSLLNFSIPFEEICRWNFIGWHSAREWKERAKESNTIPGYFSG